MEHKKKAPAPAEESQERPEVSPAVIRRLPRYFRYLRMLIRQGRMRISSGEFSRMMHLTASQIRQDLNCFGGFGQQGYGYNAKYLYSKISELLGTTEGYTAVIVGAGNLGRALAATHMFERRGVTRTAMFDIRPELVGSEIYGIPVYHIDDLFEYCKNARTDIGVLTVPKEAAYDVARTLADAGVRGIWNFANMELPETLSGGTVVENIHLGDSLMTLCYAIKTQSEKSEVPDET